MSYSVYRINLPESLEAVVFVNGFVARDKPGTACAIGRSHWLFLDVETAFVDQERLG